MNTTGSKILKVEQNEKRRTITVKKLLVVGLIVLVALGSVIGTTAALAKTQAPPQSSVTIKATFHDDMRKLWEDHITWTRVVIIDAFGADPTGTVLPDFNFALARLLANQDDIGNAIKPYYGNSAGDQLTALLKIHINTAGDILFALKSSNTTALNAAITAWYANANDIAVFLNNANPKNWPLDETKVLMKEHLDLTTAEVLARFQGRWADDIAAYDAVHQEILMMADVLSDGIIAQFPQKFTDGAGR